MGILDLGSDAGFFTPRNEVVNENPQTTSLARGEVTHHRSEVIDSVKPLNNNSL